MDVIFIATMLEILIVVILLAIIFVAAMVVGYDMKRLFNRNQGDFRIEASAIVLNVEQTGVYTGQHEHVRVLMQVMPEKGRNFVAEVNEVLSATDLVSIQYGCMVKVQYNPSNTKEVMLIRAA